MNDLKNRLFEYKPGDIVIMEGAGIRCGGDVRRLIGLGAQGTGISSALAITDDRAALLTELFDALD